MKIEKFLSQNPSFQVVVAGNSIFNSVTADLKDLGLSMMEALVLVAIFFEKEKVARPTQIKEAFGISKANISHCIRSLEKKKLIKRAMHESDARGYVLSLSVKGHQTCTSVVSYFDKLQNRLERNIDGKALEIFGKTLKSVQSLHNK